MTDRPTVVLSRAERKDRLAHGEVKAISEELNVDPALVSRVLNGRQRHAAVETAIARRVVREPNERAFPPRDSMDQRDRLRRRSAA